MFTILYEEYEHDKHSRVFYYIATTVFSLVLLYLLTFKQETLSNVGWGVIGTIIGLILQQLYAIAFKKHKKEVKQ